MTFKINVEKTIGKHFECGLGVHSDAVGVEIEIEGRDLPEGPITKFFYGKGDGSLRNGMEYVSHPIERKNVQPAVHELAETLEKKFSARLAPSYRCSTHIHENYNHLTFSDVLGAYAIWAVAEPAVFRAIPEGRDGSLFCVSSYESGDTVDFIGRFCKDIGCGFSSGFRPRGKYSSQNITRLGPGDGPALGTIEYRIFPFSLDGDQVQEWCDWLGNLKTLVSQTEDRTFLTLVQWAEKNPVEFLTRVFGRQRFNPHESAALVDFGARQGYEIARVIAANYKENPQPKSKIRTTGSATIMEPQFLNIQPLEVAQAQPVDFPPEGVRLDELRFAGFRADVEHAQAAGRRRRAAARRPR